jgi:UPF0716 family protein affecting phage T7 exclusion
MGLSAKTRRDVQRSAHLVASVILLAYLYTPLGDNDVIGVMIRVMVVPVLAVTGLLMWQWPRVRRMLRARRAQRAHVQPAQSLAKSPARAVRGGAYRP